jgi:hypothetical protein
LQGAASGCARRRDFHAFKQRSKDYQST